MIRLFIALLILLTPASAFAGSAEGVIPLRIAPTTLNTGKAYLLFQSSHAKSGMFSIEHVLMRIPTAAEVADFRSAKQAAYSNALPGLQRKAKGGKVQTIDEFAFEYDGPQNAFATKSGEFLIDGEMRTYLIEVPVGDYVLYGTSVSGNAVVTCNCLGTVRFNAAAGTVTNLGSLYADKVHKPSPIPHLEDNVGPSMFAYGWILGEALVPATSDSPVPEMLKAFPIAPAEFHAVGLFHEPGATSINRLAPVSGILGYDHGHVIDLRTGQLVQ